MNLIRYFVESVHEIRKVSWPSKHKLLNSTMIVIGLSLGIAIFLGLIDYGLNQLLQFIL